MKLSIIIGLLIAAALSLITNLLSGFISEKVKERQTLIWILFVVLVTASIIVAIWPNYQLIAAIEIFEVQAVTVDVQPSQNEYSIAGCNQRVKLINRGGAYTSLTQYEAILKFRGFQAVAARSEIGRNTFRPDNFEGSLQDLEIGLYPFSGHSTLNSLPSVIPPQEGIDIDIEIRFAYITQMYGVWDIHSEQIPKGADTLVIEYLLAMSDGSTVETGLIPCVHLDRKSVLSPSGGS